MVAPAAADDAQHVDSRVIEHGGTSEDHVAQRVGQPRHPPPAGSDQLLHEEWIAAAATVDIIHIDAVRDGTAESAG